jgi:hypothetical protein
MKNFMHPSMDAHFMPRIGNFLNRLWVVKRIPTFNKERRPEPESL